jgi:hypothetical protein
MTGASCNLAASFRQARYQCLPFPLRNDLCPIPKSPRCVVLDRGAKERLLQGISMQPEHDDKLSRHC